MEKPAILSTPHFILREFVEQDRNAFIACHLDPQFAQYHLERERGAGHASAVFDLFLAWQGQVPRRNIQLAILSRENGSYAGNVGARGEDLDPGQADAGIELLPSYWGAGVATEILEAFLPWVASELQIRSFIAETASGNTAAERLASKAGLQPGPGKDKTRWQAD